MSDVCGVIGAQEYAISQEEAVESYPFCSLTVVRLMIRMWDALLIVGMFSSGCGLVACRL